MSTLGLPTAITTAPDSPYRDCRSRARNQLGWSASEVTLCVVQRERRNPLLMHEYYAVTTPRQDPDLVVAHPRNVALGSRAGEVARNRPFVERRVN